MLRATWTLYCAWESLSPCRALLRVGRGLLPEELPIQGNVAFRQDRAPYRGFSPPLADYLVNVRLSFDFFILYRFNYAYSLPTNCASPES
jgi:hypothetical protein